MKEAKLDEIDLNERYPYLSEVRKRLKTRRQLKDFFTHTCKEYTPD